MLFPLHYKPWLEECGHRYNVDPLLLAAVIRAESKFFPRAVSEQGALGLMQIVPQTAIWAASEMGLVDFNPDKLYDPNVNINIGSWYLGQLLLEFDNNEVLALAAYNCGRGCIQQWLSSRNSLAEEVNFENLPYAETRSYVQKVLKNYHWYRRVYRYQEEVIGNKSRNRD